MTSVLTCVMTTATISTNLWSSIHIVKAQWFVVRASGGQPGIIECDSFRVVPLYQCLGALILYIAPKKAIHFAGRVMRSWRINSPRIVIENNGLLPFFFFAPLSCKGVMTPIKTFE